MNVDIICKIHGADAGFVREQNIYTHAVSCLLTQRIQHFVIGQEVPGADEDGFIGINNEFHQGIANVILLAGNGQPEMVIACQQVFCVQ